MPKKVILRGDALDLLYTFLDYTEAYPERVAAVLNYDQRALLRRRAELKEQISNGKDVEWDDLDRELKQLQEE